MWGKREKEAGVGENRLAKQGALNGCWWTDSYNKDSGMNIFKRTNRI
jgi:hypothetical protein